MRKAIILMGILLIYTSVWANSTLPEIYQSDAVKCEDLKCVRQHIDDLNTKILNLLTERTAYVQRAGDLKLESKVADDQKRVKDTLAIIAKKSGLLGLPNEISTEVFKVIMQKSIEFEQNYINKKNTP